VVPSSDRAKLLTDYLDAVDHALSRTARTGITATSVHPSKLPSRLIGDELRKAVVRNRVRAAAFIVWRSGTAPADASEVGAALLALAWLVNFEITPGHVYRSWPYITPADSANCPLPPVAADDIVDGLAMLTNSCAALAELGQSEKRRAIARTEWEIGIGPLHPFYDGCGRVSRYFSTLLCLWHGLDLPLHRLREDYMAAATNSAEAFANYWTSMPVISLP
jgi:hypothetical protein